MMPLKEEHIPSKTQVSDIENATSIRQRSISIWIDTYDDIFSDFDPRDYSERNISDDFLDEVKKVSLEHDYHIRELKLLIPNKARNKEDENTIIKRLQTHFEEDYQYFKNQHKARNKKSILFVIVGIAIMLGATYVSSLKSESIFKHMLFVILEPSGWFFVWMGLDHLINVSKEQKSELLFYKKMSKCKILFVDMKEKDLYKVGSV